jgi:hypothetical protein
MKTDSLLRDTIPYPTGEEEHEQGAADAEWLDLVERQAQKIAVVLMALRANADVLGDAAPEEWAAVEEPLQELWRAIDDARSEQNERPQLESGTYRRAPATTR